METRRITYLAAILVALGSCRGAGGEEEQGKGGGGPGKGGGPGVRVVSVEKVVERRLEKVGRYRGELRAEKVIEVAPDVQGRIEKLHADLGTVVEEGDLLVELDKIEMNQMVSEGKAKVEMAAASIEQARVELEKAQDELERKGPLAAKGLLTEAEKTTLEKEVSAAESALAVAQASHKSAQAAYKNLLVDRKELKVRAPFDGVISRRYLNEGALASASSPVFQLHASGKLYIRVSVPEMDVPFIEEGMTGHLALDAFPGRTFVVTVELIAPVIETTTRTCTVDLALEPDAQGPGSSVKPGMTGEVTMILDEVDGATAVPRDALVEIAEEHHVWTVSDGRAEPLPIEIIGEYGDWLRVDGIEPGAEVVVKGQLDLDPGVPVSIATLE